MKFIIQIIKGVIRYQSTRRTVMFVVLIAAMVMLFAGMTFLGGWLGGDPVGFIIYWAACAWLTLAAILLAIYDLIALRVRIRREKKHLREEIFGSNEKIPKG